MKDKISYILFLFASIISYGQVNLVADTDKKEVLVNEPVNLTIILELNGNDLIQESRLKLPDLSKFKMLGSGSEQNTFVEPRNNTIINQLLYEISIAPKQPGKMKIGSALVQVNGKIYKTEPFEINVKDAVAKTQNTANNVYINMEVEDNDVYKNQPTIAVLKAYSKDFNDLRRVGHVSFAKQENVSIKPISFAKSEIEQNSQNNMSSQVIAVVMIYPRRSGNVEINPASVTYKENSKTGKILSNKVKLNVKALPKDSPNNYKNAVGNFNVDIQNLTSTDRLEVNKPIDVNVKISGEGNMNAESLPKIIESKDYTFYKPEVHTNLRNTKNGVKGEISAKYVVIPKTAGDIVLGTEAFSFFNPQTQKYVNLGSQKLALHVMTPEQIADAKTAMERVNEYTNDVLETVNTPVIQTQNLKIEPRKKFNWVTLITNYSLMGGFFLLIVVAYATYKQRKIAQQKNKKPLGSVAETEAKIREKLKHKVDVETNVQFLKKLLEEEKYSEFFSSYEAFVNEVETKLRHEYGMGIKQYLENNKGQKLTEEYRNITQKLQIEKYSPMHSPEHLFNLLHKTEIIFLEIV